jgi:hypothetical protein
LKPAADDPLWFGKVANETTTLWAIDKQSEELTLFSGCSVPS